MQGKIKVVSLVGPTASGKTKLSVALAQRFDGEIVSADSMQIYREMQIATAKPDRQEMGGVPHHLMDFLPPDRAYSVADFVSDARKAIEDIASRGKLPFIVGGTGLYVDSLLNNVKFTEAKRDEAESARLRALYDEKGIDHLLAILAEFDRESAERLAEERNPKRIIRAIEVYRTSGVTLTEQNRLSRAEESPYSPIKLGLFFRDREKLYSRINLRVDMMLSQGLIDEAREVLSRPLSDTAVMAIGYKELAPFIRGELPLDECVETLKRETRRYAKRQITWFKRDPEINRLYADDYTSFEELYLAAESIIGHL